MNPLLIFATALLISGPATCLTATLWWLPVRTSGWKGVDASKLNTERGETARQVLIDIVGDSELTCRLTGERTWRREVGYCTTADGIDINRAIIEQGAALSCPRFDPRYLPFEQPAALAAQPRASYCLPRR